MTRAALGMVSFNFHPETRAESSRMESCVPLEIARRKSLSTDQLLREIFLFLSNVEEPSSGKEQLSVVFDMCV